MDTNLLKIPMQKVAVRLHYAGGEALSGEIYLSQHSSIHLGPMTVREMLEEEAPFFAFASAAGDCLLNKDQIEVVRYAADLFRDELESASLVERGRTVVTDLASGLRVEGELCEDLPPERSRRIDGLNQAGRFLRLRQGDEFLLVNKTKILRCYF